MTSWIDFVRDNRPAQLPRLSPQRLDNAELAESYFHYYGIDFEHRYRGLEHFFGAFTGAGYDVATHVFRLPGATATAWIYHGYYDHVGLFNHAIDYCLSRGYSVVAYDLPGHGLSSGERASVASFRHYVEVIGEALVAVEPFGLPKRRIALAQSTGAAVLMTHLLEGGEADFDKLVLLAPLVRPMGWQWGRHTHSLLSPFVKALPRRWSQNSNDAEFLHWLRHEEPLQCTDLPLAWVTALKKWEAEFHWLGHCQRELLIVQGECDKTVDWQFNIPAILAHFPKAEVCYLHQGRHHLVKESEAIRQKIWQRISDYLDK